MRFFRCLGHSFRWVIAVRWVGMRDVFCLLGVELELFALEPSTPHVS
jgi:hypothetical protein